jgi:hypothetical protein
VKKQSSVLSDLPLVNCLAVAISMKVIFGGDSLIKWSIKLGNVAVRPFAAGMLPLKLAGDLPITLMWDALYVPHK